MGGWLTDWRAQLGRRLIKIGKALASEAAVEPEMPHPPTQSVEPQALPLPTQTASPHVALLPTQAVDPEVSLLPTQAHPDIAEEVAPDKPPAEDQIRQLFYAALEAQTPDNLIG